jgi:hypothetical protein
MKHSRPDYARIQDPAGLIPDDEPVFLLRAQDAAAPAAVRCWADIAASHGATFEMVRAAREQADLMYVWGKKKTPDLPEAAWPPVPALAENQTSKGGPAMNSAADRIRHLPCGCREDAPTGETVHFCLAHGSADITPADLKIFETNITTANNLIIEWSLIAASIAQQCQWRPRGQCLITCQGIAVCNLDGLTLINPQGQPIGATQRVELQEPDT